LILSDGVGVLGSDNPMKFKGRSNELIYQQFTDVMGQECVREMLAIMVLLTL
jgi:hypothetical protein